MGPRLDYPSVGGIQMSATLVLTITITKEVSNK